MPVSIMQHQIRFRQYSPRYLPLYSRPNCHLPHILKLNSLRNSAVLLPQDLLHFHPQNHHMYLSIHSAIQTYQIPSFSSIDYSLVSKVSRSFVDFTFTASNMKWTFLKVKLWLTARSDLLIGSFVLGTLILILRKHCSKF